MCTSPGSTACDTWAGSMIAGRSGGVFAKTDDAVNANAKHASGRKTSVRVCTDMHVVGVGCGWRLAWQARCQSLQNKDAAGYSFVYARASIPNGGGPATS